MAKKRARSRSHAGTKKGSALLKYGIPIAVAGGALLLLTRSASAATPPKPSPNPNPNPNVPPPTPGRAKEPPGGFPAGSGRATVLPLCPPGDAACQAGLLVHTAPTVASRLIAGTGPSDPSNVLPTSLHALTGDRIAVVRQGISDGTGREWWEVVTPTGGRGFVSAHGPGEPKDANFRDVVPPTPPATAGLVGALRQHRATLLRPF